MEHRARTGGGSNGPLLVRRLNQRRVLDTLRAESPLRLVDLADRCGLSRPTVSVIVGQLEAAGWVEYSAAASVAGIGRPARTVRFRTEAGCVVGVDVGPRHVSAAVADLTGAVRATVHRACSARRDADRLIARMRAAIADALDESGYPRARVCAAAGGSPGILDARSAAFTRVPGLPAGHRLELRAQLRRSLRCPVSVDNDVNLAVLGEQWRGVVGSRGTAVFVWWDERVGAGICVEGRLHRGASHAAGEIGYLSVLEPPEGPLIDREGRGRFERATGAAAVRELARAAGIRAGSADPARVLAAAPTDPACAEILDTVAARLARGLAPLLLVLDPDTLVMGGSLSAAGDPVLAAIGRHVRALAPAPVRLESSSLGPDAVVTGALRLALDGADAVLPGADAVGARAVSPSALASRRGPGAP